MELRIVGTQIWLNNILFSEGLSGPPYAAKLREAEEWAREFSVKQSKLTAAYDKGYQEGKEEAANAAYDEGFYEGYDKGKADGILQTISPSSA